MNVPLTAGIYMSCRRNDRNTFSRKLCNVGRGSHDRVMSSYCIMHRVFLYLYRISICGAVSDKS